MRAPHATDPALQDLISYLQSLERAEPAVLRAHQDERLDALHTHFLRHSPWYGQRWARAGLAPGARLSLANLHRLAPFSRAELQQQGDAAFTPAPPAHGEVRVTQTSGSTGEPVLVARTALCHLHWMACGMREHTWWQRDVEQSLFVVRANLARPFIRQHSWGPPASLLGPTGPGFAASLSLSTADLAGLMDKLAPAYVLLYPSVLRDLLQRFTASGSTPPGLAQVRTMGETLTDELRQAVRSAWNVPVVDSYSSQEAGVIAIQCPDGEGYHLMAENLIVEVLRPDGSACAPGEAGQVVITDLHNHATPLVRYAIGDVAEMGGDCRCGCTLPMLRAIRGRQRNLIAYPDGTRRWPLVGFARFRDIAPITRYQVVQHTVDLLELRLVCAPLSAPQEQALRHVVEQALGHPFAIRLTYHPRGLPTGPNGKREEVVSLVSP